jgi:DUF1365 family protein
MSGFTSALYFGEVVHQRFGPKGHRFRYGMFQMLFDLDELPHLERRLRLFSHNRFNAFGFYDRDHGDGCVSSLRAYVDGILTLAEIPHVCGRVFLLCMPRVLGNIFNPISIYYCYDDSGKLVAMIYEVNNTFGQRHAYLIPVAGCVDGFVRQSCEKGFYVSPFMDMEMTYDFNVSVPADTIATAINGRGSDGGLLIFAAFRGERRGLSDRALLAALLAHPFLALGVVAAIHWEALKLFTKGVRLRHRPPPPEACLTVVRPSAGAVD